MLRKNLQVHTFGNLVEVWDGPPDPDVSWRYLAIEKDKLNELIKTLTEFCSHISDKPK